MYPISRLEIMQQIGTRWVGDLRFDGKEGFRELEQYGNRHAVFDHGAEWGYVHEDQYNATSFPTGTANHLAKWTQEKTGIGETFARLLVWGVMLYGGYKAVKYLNENF